MTLHARSPSPQPDPRRSGARPDPAQGKNPTPGLYLLSLVLPLSTLIFLVTGPHRWFTAVLWLAAPAALVALDGHGGAARRDPPPRLSPWSFDALLYLHAAIQAANVVLMARLASRDAGITGDRIVSALLVGTGSAYSGVVVAHELIHRSSAAARWIGRVLLSTALYDHFFTEHLRGHHLRVATAEDPVTARLGEDFWTYARRAWPGELLSAWAIAARRRSGHGSVRALMQNAVAHGVVAEMALGFGLWWGFGHAALVLFLIQAAVGHVLIYAVNYFQHWGLQRSRRKVSPVDSWESDSLLTDLTLLRLARHADHHALASKPYQQLRHLEASPRLPRGYFGMVALVLFRNAEAQRLMTDELRRVGLRSSAA